MEHWYVAHTQPRGETLALVNLLRQKFGAYLPRYLKRRRHARRIDWVASPFFPRYLFVKMDPGAVRWRAIHSTIGVSHLVCAGDKPLAMPDGIVESIQSREDAKVMVGMDPAISFKKGAQVQILSGPLCDQVGLFDCTCDDGRAVILLELLGRQVEVRVPNTAVAAYA